MKLVIDTPARSTDVHRQLTIEPLGRDQTSCIRSNVEEVGRAIENESAENPDKPGIADLVHDSIRKRCIRKR